MSRTQKLSEKPVYGWTLGMLACLTLLIAPAHTLTPGTCLVVAATEHSITLQCTGNGHLQANDLVRLQPVKK